MALALLKSVISCEASVVVIFHQIMALALLKSGISCAVVNRLALS